MLIESLSTTPLIPITTPAAPEPLAPGAGLEPTGTTPAPAEPSAETPAEPQFDRAHGMLRKLIAGGFNAVAAARHQAKFAAELAEAGIDLPTPGARHGRPRGVQPYQPTSTTSESLDVAA